MKSPILAVAALCCGTAVWAQPFEAQLSAAERHLWAARPLVLPAKPHRPDPALLDRLFKADDEVLRLRTLLGQYVVGQTVNGPILIANPVEIHFGIDFRDVLALFPFLRPVELDGRIRIRIGDNVAGEYGKVRAEFLARLPRVILLEKAAGIERDLSRGHLVWARNLQILSQPECAGLAGREPWPYYCS